MIFVHVMNMKNKLKYIIMLVRYKISNTLFFNNRRPSTRLMETLT